MGVGHDHVDRLDWGVQLLGDDLAQRRPNVLAHLRLSRVDRDLAILADVQPGAEVVRRGLAAETSAATTPSAGRLRLRDISISIDQAEDENASAHRFQEAATIQVEAVCRTFKELVALGFDWDVEVVTEFGSDAGSLVHRLTSFTASAAMRTAAMIRG